MSDRKLANIMIIVSKAVVMPHAQDMVARLSDERPSRVAFRVGSGQATYHRVEPSGYSDEKAHSIVYGAKMITEKRCPNTLAKWLTAREIKKYGFFGGKVSFEHAMAHTVLHEIAHYITSKTGGRIRGSVHNEAFYDNLKRLHNRCGQQVLTSLREECAKHHVSLAPGNPKPEPEKQGIAPEEVNVSGFYAIKFRGGRNVIKVRKKNPKTVDCLVISGPAKNQEVRSPYACLLPLDEGELTSNAA